MKTPTLTHLQLCDLANFALELPQKIGQRTVLRPRMEPWVTYSWNGDIRFHVETWLDARLRDVGLGPRVPEGRGPGGAPSGRMMPREIVPWVMPRFQGRQAVA